MPRSDFREQFCPPEANPSIDLPFRRGGCYLIARLLEPKLPKALLWNSSSHRIRRDRVPDILSVLQEIEERESEHLHEQMLRLRWTQRRGKDADGAAGPCKVGS
jgi:hypothetical protein